MNYLTAKQWQEYLSHGFVLVPQVFTPAEITEMVQATEELLKAAQSLKHQTQIFKGSRFVFENQALHRVVWAGAYESTLLNFGADQRILTPVSEILNSSDMDQLINQIHFKMPGDDIEFEWHQDSQHRGYGTADWTDVNGQGSYVQTLTALDAVTADKGPVRFIPGSHLKGHQSLNLISDLETHFKNEPYVDVLMQPGDLVLFSPYVIHSSQKNVSTTPRRVFINGYAYPGANHKIYPGEGSGRRLTCPNTLNKSRAKAG